MSGGGDLTTTEKSRTNVPPFLAGGQQNVVGAGFNMNLPFLNTPAYQLQGLNSDQLKAMDLARGTAQSAFTQSPEMAQAMQQMMGGNQAQAAQAQAAQLGANDFKPFMNPFMDSVGKSTLGNMRSEYQNADANLAGKYAASQAFGGSGEAIARGQLARGYNQNVGTAINNLMSQGYDRSTALAMANTQNQQQTNLANAQNQQQANLFNATQATELPSNISNLKSADQQRQMSALAALLGVGDQQQQQGQKALDAPWTALQRLLATTPMNQMNTAGMSEKTQPDTSPSPLMKILGMGASLLGAPMTGGGSIAGALAGAAGLSDKNMKTDITKLGKDPDSGLDMYSYRYRDDPKSYPKVVGPMAQDIEKANPGSTRKIGGKMIVPLEMLLGQGSAR
jgi:hypothetical protein